jgi:hypothetical protein
MRNLLLENRRDEFHQPVGVPLVVLSAKKQGLIFLPSMEHKNIKHQNVSCTLRIWVGIVAAENSTLYHLASPEIWKVVSSLNKTLALKLRHLNLLKPSGNFTYHQV